MSYVALRTASIRNTSLSEEGQHVQTVTTAFFDAREQLLSLFGDKAGLIADIREMAVERGEPNWDGYGAEPVDAVAVARAEAIIRALPDGMQLPEISAEPDGEISLDWVRTQRRLMSVSAGLSDRLAFAWLNGTDSGHGVERFDGITIPPHILAGILMVFDGDASVRAA